jgi:hypothetical protein
MGPVQQVGGRKQKLVYIRSISRFDWMPLSRRVVLADVLLTYNDRASIHSRSLGGYRRCESRACHDSKSHLVSGSHEISHVSETAEACERFLLVVFAYPDRDLEVYANRNQVGWDQNRNDASADQGYSVFTATSVLSGILTVTTTTTTETIFE